MKPETAKYISDAIISEIEQNRTTRCLVQQLREDRAKYITKEAWDVVIRFLENDLPPLGHRPEEDHYFRDKFIVEEYKNRKGTKSLNKICQDIEDQMRREWGRKETPEGLRPIGVSQIRKIIEKHIEEQEPYEKEEITNK